MFPTQPAQGCYLDEEFSVSTTDIHNLLLHLYQSWIMMSGPWKKWFQVTNIYFSPCAFKMDSATSLSIVW